MTISNSFCKKSLIRSYVLDKQNFCSDKKIGEKINNPFQDHFLTSKFTYKINDHVSIKSDFETSKTDSSRLYSTNKKTVKKETKTFYLTNKQGKEIGKIGTIHYIPEGNKPNNKIYFMTGLDHPSVMFETFHSEISTSRNSEIYSIDLLGNGGSRLFKNRAIFANDLLSSLVQTILQSSNENESIQLVGISMGSVAVATLTDLYWNHPEKFKELLGNRKLDTSLIIAPIPNVEMLALGAQANKEFLYPTLGGILLHRRMEWNYNKKRQKELYLSHHSKSDQQYLREIISRNAMKANPFSILSFPNHQNQTHILDLAKKGYLKIIFHENDQVFGVENPEDWAKLRGFFVLEGSHSAGTGKDIAEEYREGFNRVLNEEKTIKEKDKNPRNQYNQWRAKQSLGIRASTKDFTTYLNFSLLYGIKLYKNFGINVHGNFLWQTGINWNAQGVFSFRPTFGVGLEFWKQPMHLNFFGGTRFKSTLSKESSIEAEPQVGIQLSYTALELIELGLETSLGKNYSIHTKEQNSSFFNTSLSIGFHF